MKRATVFFAFLIFVLLLSSGCRPVPPPPPDIKEKADLYPEDSFYNDAVLQYLGWNQEDIIELYGEPDIRGSIGGPGGEFLYYGEKNISFIFAGDEGIERVVNNLDLYPKAEVLGVTVGMTFDQIQEILGKPFDRGYSDFSGSYTMIYWLGEIRKEEMLGELELYFNAPTDDSPTELLVVHWKKYWW